MKKKKVSDLLVAEKIMGFVGFRLFKFVGCLENNGFS